MAQTDASARSTTLPPQKNFEEQAMSRDFITAVSVMLAALLLASPRAPGFANVIAVASP